MGELPSTHPYIHPCLSEKDHLFIFFEFSDRITYSEDVINLCSDERSHDPQVFLKLPSAYRFFKVFIFVCSKHHFLILGQELPHPSAYLSEKSQYCCIRC